MGEGWNSIYLAQLGWEVWGFDPAATAVRLANQRAAALGLMLHTASVADDQFAFGTERFRSDLVQLGNAFDPCRSSHRFLKAWWHGRYGSCSGLCGKKRSVEDV